MSIKRRIIKAPSGKVYVYEKISGIPVDEYRRQDARKWYVPHPRAPRKPTALELEAAKRAMELRAQGYSQIQIADALNINRYRVQRLLGVR
jgi:hypothetical protein